MTAAVAARTAARRAPRRRPRAGVHVAVAHDAAHVQHLRERVIGEGGGRAHSWPQCCVPRETLLSRAVGAAQEINGVRFRRALRRTLPLLGGGGGDGGGSRYWAASSKIAAIGVRSLAPLVSVHPLVRFASARLRSGPLGLAWLGSARSALAQPRAPYASARGSSARERSLSESHACQRRPAQIMVGCVERRGGGCGDCEYETRGRRRSFLVAYVVSSLSLSLTRSIPLPRSLARSLGLRPRLDRWRRRRHKNRRRRCSATGRDSRRYPWLGLGRGAIWRTVRRANECPRWPLRATRTTMGDTERARCATSPSLPLAPPRRQRCLFPKRLRAPAVAAAIRVKVNCAPAHARQRPCAHWRADRPPRAASGGTLRSRSVPPPRRSSGRAASRLAAERKQTEHAFAASADREERNGDCRR